MIRRSDAELADALHRVALELEEPRLIGDAIMRLLAHGGRASGKTLARILRRRRSDVMKACDRLASEGRITRVGQKWRAQ